MKEGTSTGELLSRIHQGDPAAPERVLRRVLPMLFKHAHAKLPRAARGPIDTSDVVQDVIVGILPRLQKFDPAEPEKLRAYLQRSVTNRIIDELRRAQRRGTSVYLDDPASPQVRAAIILPDEDASWKEDFALYLAALKEISASDRKAIVARFHLGLSYEEIAALTARSSAEVTGVAVRRALERLEKQLARAGLNTLRRSTQKK